MPLGNRTVLVAVWRVRVGRVKLYLLDTDLEENAPWDRELSARLYGGDRETRVQQEIILGIGGVRVLKAIGHRAGRLPPQRRPRRVRRRCSASATCARAGGRFDAALEEVRRTTVFTTHTPVAAGHDAFPFHLVETHLAGAWGDLGGYREKFLALGHYDNGGGPLFNMTALALRTSGAVNGVSQLHGEVTKQMWQPIWPGPAADDAAGRVHHQRRPRADLDVVGDRRRCSSGTWAPTGSTATTIRRSPIACWRFPTRSCGRRASRCATFLFNFIRERARHALDDGGASPRRAIVAAGTMFDHNTLTIGFARRFTGYKRPELIFTRPRSPGAHPQRAGPRRCRSSSPARRIRPTTSASITCSASTGARSTRSSAAASPSSTTTTCTSRTSSCRAATSG